VSEPTNSAERLYQLLAEMSASAGRNNSQPISQLFVDVFGLDQVHTPEFWERMVLFDALFERIGSELEAAGTNPEPYLEGFIGARDSLRMINLQTGASTFHQVFDRSTLRSIQLAGVRIAESWREEPVPDDELADLAHRLDELGEELRGGKFDARVAELAQIVIEAISHAIKVYRISGIKAFEDALATSLGQFFQFVRRNSDDPPPGEQVKKVWDVIVKLEGVVARAATYLPILAEHLPKLLEAF
jgi:hypothetical protein